MATHVVALSRIVRYDVVAKDQEAEQEDVYPVGIEILAARDQVLRADLLLRLLVEGGQ